MLSALLSELVRNHFPAPAASEADINAFESRVGWSLDEELRSFYRCCNGARLFRNVDSQYWILPLDRIVRTRVAIYGRDEAERGPDSWYAICDTGEGDFVSIDHRKTIDGRYPLFDCFHETFHRSEERQMIARSFSDFLARALKSEGSLYWLSSSFMP